MLIDLEGDFPVQEKLDEIQDGKIVLGLWEKMNNGREFQNVVCQKL
jgi:hypothetical protein